MSDTFRVNYEANQRIMEPVKTAVGTTISMAERLMRDGKNASQTEITGGAWDKERGVYSVVDQANGITTEYKVRKSINTQTGFGISETSYKTYKDDKGNDKRVEVEYDPKRNEWVKKNIYKKAVDRSPLGVAGKVLRPKFMGNLIETKTPNGSTFSLRIEKTKIKPIGT